MASCSRMSMVLASFAALTSATRARHQPQALLLSESSATFHPTFLIIHHAPLRSLFLVSPHRTATGVAGIVPHVSSLLRKSACVTPVSSTNASYIVPRSALLCRVTQQRPVCPTKTSCAHQRLACSLRPSVEFLAVYLRGRERDWKDRGPLRLTTQA